MHVYKDGGPIYTTCQAQEVGGVDSTHAMPYMYLVSIESYGINVELELLKWPAKNQKLVIFLPKG
jgi:hypothetical protein